MFKNQDKDSQLMIADFGLSKIIQDEQNSLKTTCGTPGYMAPELIQNIGHGKGVDCWSIGVMSYFLYVVTINFEKVQS